VKTRFPLLRVPLFGVNNEFHVAKLLVGLSNILSTLQTDDGHVGGVKFEVKRASHFVTRKSSIYQAK
jgi:hypothetical protein